MNFSWPSRDIKFQMQEELSVFIAFICVIATTIIYAYCRYLIKIAEERKKKDELARKRVDEFEKRVDEYAERERQRRRDLELSVQLAEDVQRKKWLEIERLETMKADEEANIRLRQQEALEKAERKKQEEERQRQEEKEAIKRANTEGALCIFSDAKGELSDMELRIPLLDAVGFITSISHVKSCLRAHYHGNPQEYNQKIIYDGRVLLDNERLRDLFSQLPQKSKPMLFHVAISKRKINADTSKQQFPIKSEEDSKNNLPESNEEVRELTVKEEAPAAVKITIKGGDSPCHVSINFGSTISNLRSLCAVQMNRSAESIRFVYGGRVLKSEETLSEVMVHCRDKSMLTLHVLMTARTGDFITGNEDCSDIRDEIGQPPSLIEIGARDDSVAQATTSYDATKTQLGSASGGVTPPSMHSPRLDARSPSIPSEQRRQEAMLEALRKRLEATMKQAFWNRLEETLKSESPDYDWICKLYGELGDRLCALTPRRSDIVEETRTALDVELFSGMVRNQAVDVGDLRRIVGFTFSRLLSLCSPARDGELQKSRLELENMLDGGSSELTFAKFVVPFLKAFHQALDDIESDIAAFHASAALAGSPRASPSPGRTARSPSPGSMQASQMSLEEVRARLVALGVSEDAVRKCVERRQLDALLDVALRRQRLETSAAADHDQATAQEATRASSSGNSSENAVAVIKGTAKVLFKVGFGVTAASVELELGRELSVAQARIALSDTLPDHPAASRLQLVHAGRVLRDADRVCELFPAATESSATGAATGEAAAAGVVHVVVSKACAAAGVTAASGAAAAASDSDAGMEITFRGRQVRRQR
jgi:hypothetical protein